jgi:hypothetical protein
MALTKGTTFSDGGTVDAAGLNNLVDNATIDTDAIKTIMITDINVTADKLAADSVQTLKIVDDAVTNAKLEEVAARTVKVNATDATANPTDVAMSNGADVAENKLLVGTTDSINAVKFDTDLELDATDNAAADIRVADTLISGKSTVTVVPANDTLLVYDADGSGNKLGKATVTSMMQSLPATDDTSGVTRVATVKRSVAPTSANGINSADVSGAINAGPMLAKAWVEFTSTGIDEAQTITNSFNITSLTRNGIGVYDIIFGNGVTDTKFDLPSDKYILFSNGITTLSDGYYLMGRITSRTGTGVGCTVKFAQYNDYDDFRDPDVIATLVFFGLTS